MVIYHVGRNREVITAVEDCDAPVIIGGALCFYEDGRIKIAFGPSEWLMVKELDPEL